MFDRENDTLQQPGLTVRVRPFDLLTSAFGGIAKILHRKYELELHLHRMVSEGLKVQGSAISVALP
jgi:hypothetical protein